MILQKQLRCMAAMALIMVVAGCGNEKPPIPFADSLRSSNVTLKTMKDGQAESLLVGNGDLYGIVWEKEGELFMRITKNDVWDARIDVSEDGDMPRVDIINNLVSGMTGTPPSYYKTYPQPRCAAALRLGPVYSGDGFSAHLDLEKAYVSIAQGSGKNTVIRVLHGRNVMLIRSPHEVTIEEVKAETLPSAEMGNTGGVSWLWMKMPGDIDYKGMQYALAVATRGDLKAVSLVTSFESGGDVLERAINLADETVREQEKSLVAGHETSWHNFWSRSGIALEDSVMQRWWYRMLYFAHSVCRPGTSPVNLMPPLATDETPWHSDYHHNYNSWQAFWPLPTANHAGLADPWITYLNQMIPRFQFLAKETYGCEGIYAPISSFLHEPDPAGCMSNNKRQISFNPWGLTIGCAGMNVQNAWQIYLCDPDTSYLKSKIYPLIRESALFYVSFMEKCQRDERGMIKIGPSYSPEHGSFGIFNCPFDLAYIHYTYDAMIQAAGILGTDQDLVKKCQNLKALIPEYPVALNGDGEPVVVDWEGCGYGEVPVHNITVPASPVFPCDQVTWFSADDQKELFKRTINATSHNFNNSNVMFNIARARLSMPEAVNEAKEWFMSRELPNGLFVWQGHQHGTFMPEMIGVAGLINEFLLQSVGNKIRLFPCWPSGQDGSFHGLRAQGGFIVSSEFSVGQVASVTIESAAGGILSLLSPWDTLYVNGKQVTIGTDGLYTVDTHAGDVFHFSESVPE